MKILILGGTKFLGRALTEAAIAQGHDVTLFHRGLHDANAFPNVRHIIGDRNNDLDLLQGREWDAVIDTSGYEPESVLAAAEQLKNQVKHYTFISTISVYEDLKKVNVNEAAPVAKLTDQMDPGQKYGAKKALCELAVQQEFPNQTLVIRPGLIVGPYDVSDRFTYWPARFHRGGEVLVPLPKERKLQFIDVRDLSAWIIRLVEQEMVGTLHASGSDYTMEEVVQACTQTTQHEVICTWVPEEFLVANEVGEWMEMPLWIQSDSLVGMFSLDNAKAFANGLTTRPLIEIVRDTLAWDQSRSMTAVRAAGMDPAREEELLLIWSKNIF
ncbi:NAD-dependent epimerase/dehydratase family protein [Paenibacillus sp. CGMCC 1.16610]|uniref:NAD-dependent epimerase/dehydratase family protein n=1 Tax=Paenibacillus anseongense TaxID=2682845 RepID=A0ABW9UJQ1_9BACL|nr:MULTISPECIES: NAD-dependent epimerase/dehydratase family protein [Paenibacillus]MBA2941576.1 NAD-dependent epimerase/dehydratase family protein [Paenibacillus sp. CGMCC 1.16610]MVQ40389.1 NAD-dependent epimerase/dehydratase family protein [Paenibacillus anseongense]